MTAETEWIMELNPKEFAKSLIQKADEAWLSEFTRSLDRHRARDDFDRFLTVWNLNQNAAAGLFNISRQAIGKWRTRGVPKEHIEAIANLSAATDLLSRFLKRDRIPAVVRRPSARLSGQSLLDLVGAGRTHDVLIACREMFAFGHVHT